MVALFLSYRRAESQDVVGRIYDKFNSDLPAVEIFRDLDSIPPGKSFPTVIREALGKSKIALIIIGPDWSTIKDAKGRVRLEDPEDFVRTEVECALSLGILVVPVLVRGASMPPREQLPESLHPLVGLHAIQIRSDPDFHRDMDQLIKHVERELNENKARFKFTEQALTALRKAKVPEVVLSKLAPLKEKELPQADFAKELARLLTPEELQRDENVLLNHTEVLSNPQPWTKYVWPLCVGSVIAVSFFFGVNYLIRQMPPAFPPEVLQVGTGSQSDAPQTGSGKILLHLVQVLLIAWCFFALRDSLSDTQNRIEPGTVSKQVFRQFKKGWVRLWFLWLVAYGVLTLIEVFSIKGEIPHVVTDGLDCLCSYAMFRCFLVLDQSSLRLRDNINQDVFRWNVVIVSSFGAAIFSLAAVDRLYNPDSHGFGVLFVGLFAGLAMAFLVGRFDSKWLAVPRWQLGFLYVYALIQVVYPFLNKLTPAWTYCIFAAFLVGKLMLFYVVSQLLLSDKMIDYLKAAETGKLGPQEKPGR
jgi:hypothetical protein